MAKVDTFNQLDHRFQLQPHHDPNHIFPEEYEMIKELRTKRPALSKESDKFLVVFLCARRHNLAETLDLLDKYTSKRKSLGFDEKPPTLHDIKLQEHMHTGAIFSPTGAIDKHERMVQYVWVAKDKPKERKGIEILYAWAFWETQYMIDNEPLKHLRNGHVMVISLTGASWSNIDLSSKGREWSKAMTGIFPKRMRAVYLTGGGAFLKAAWEVGKHVLAKKLVERMRFVNSEQLRDEIPENWLLTEYGGKLDVDIENWIQDILQNDEVRGSSETLAHEVSVKMANVQIAVDPAQSTSSSKKKEKGSS